MALNIEPSIARQLPPIVAKSLSDASVEDQHIFVGEYNKRKKSLALMMFLAIFLPIQMFFLGKTGLGIAFILTGGGFSIWWIIEIFLTPKRVREYNHDIASTIMRDIKMLA